METTSGSQAAPGGGRDRPAAAAILALAAQLLLAGLVVYVYDIEGPVFFRLFVLAAFGFAASLLLQARWRLPFFVLLSLAGVFLVFEPADGLWLIACGMALIGLCHLPVPLWVRVLLLLAVGGVLAASRAGAIASPWSAAVWPILGSMFMFRLVIYARSIRTEAREGRGWAALGYFFMFPNLVFPLFPVIDYQTFRRTHFDKDAGVIYQQGLLWIARGIVHLLLYRLVYHRVVNDAADVEALGDLVQWMLGTFLLYLRVSGMFHLVVGLLHLFGFRLPETHKLYYLSRNFTDLWRRINIYWKDFMMSFVFYPVYFRVKKLPPAVAVGIATGAVFATTWLLHSYQWFWLRGGFPVTPQDILFWGLLGALVVVGAVRELRPGPKTMRAAQSWSLSAGLRTSGTFLLFCFLWSLWSAESVGEWIWTLGAAVRVDLNGLLMIAAIVAALTWLGGRSRDALSSRRPVMRTVTPLAVSLILALPAVQGMLPASINDKLAALQSTGLNTFDAELQHRGYYEQLDVRARLATQDQALPGVRREDWQDLPSTGVLRIRDDFLERDLLPDRQVIWNGHAFTTNRWGMRDRDYERDKPPGTLRIALLGPSHAMGNGVGDGETFEALVEERLNREFRLPGVSGFEVLNFAVDGYCLTQQVRMLDQRVAGFEPDVVIMTTYAANRTMTQVYVYKILWRGIEIPYPEFKVAVGTAGLSSLGGGGLPVPFESWRNLAEKTGIDTRMPSAEIHGRIRRIAGQVSSDAVARFARTTRESGARPLVLALNAVVDAESLELPDQEALRAANLPVINLLRIYPEDRRAALRVAPWDEHPNVEGHQLIADRLYPELTAYLSREFGST
jgi:D-alanyl-lipoteichoic acid acyltransferase DltB (MBOAT superfamily)